MPCGNRPVSTHARLGEHHDAPLEERRARAVSLRRVDPDLAAGFGALDPAAIDEVRASRGAEFARAWHLYLAGSTAAFTTGTMQLFQVLFARSGVNNMPWTRDHIYPPGD